MKLAVIIFLMSTFSTLAFADLPSGLHLDHDGIIVNAQGTPVPINHWNLSDYCPRGTHVPSIRELAEISQQKGAKILEVSAGKPPAGFDLIDAVNADGKRDQFYYRDIASLNPSSCS